MSKRKRKSAVDTLFAKRGSKDNFFTLTGRAARWAAALVVAFGGDQRSTRATYDLSGFVARDSTKALPSLGDPPRGRRDHIPKIGGAGQPVRDRSRAATINISGAGSPDRRVPSLGGPPGGKRRRVPSLGEPNPYRSVPSLGGPEAADGPNISGSPTFERIAAESVSDPYLAGLVTSVEAQIYIALMPEEKKAAYKHLIFRITRLDGFIRKPGFDDMYTEDEITEALDDIQLKLAKDELTAAGIWKTTLGRAVLREERRKRQAAIETHQGSEEERRGIPLRIPEWWGKSPLTWRRRPYSE